jgi:hypothetical protein
MTEATYIRYHIVSTLAVKLKRNLLSADELSRELSSLSNTERTALLTLLETSDKRAPEWDVYRCSEYETRSYRKKDAT